MSKIEKSLPKSKIKGAGSKPAPANFPPLSMKNAKGVALAQKRLALRKQLWPKLNEENLWKTDNNGFTPIPRGLSLICRAINEMSKKVSPGATYVHLWCRAHEGYFVDTTHHPKQAFASGFRGQRAIASWKKRILVLKKLGFIDTAPGDGGDPSYVILLNPYKAFEKHAAKSTPGLSKETITAVRVTISEIGAKDLA
jgi:hypothetical protein